ncbi:hypothetical protein AT6N2_C0874 [Agrobacterium tumefaciens]|nr:hypothetical protein AT6N2_C0874 [Agrobacterium tumefaciens]
MRKEPLAFLAHMRDAFRGKRQFDGAAIVIGNTAGHQAPVFESTDQFRHMRALDHQPLAERCLTNAGIVHDDEKHGELPRPHARIPECREKIVIGLELGEADEETERCLQPVEIDVGHPARELVHAISVSCFARREPRLSNGARPASSYPSQEATSNPANPL